MKLRNLLPFAALLLAVSCSSAPKVPPVVYEARNEAARMVQLGNKTLREGSPEAARGYYAEAYRIYTATDDPEGRVQALDGLGRMEDKTGAQAQADYWAEARRIADESGNVQIIALARLLQAEIDLRSPDTALVKASLDTALDCALILKSRSGDRARALRLAASAAKALADYPQALLCLEDASTIDRKAKAYIEYASDRFLVASVHSKMGNYPLASAALAEALEWDRKAENSPGIAGDYTALGVVSNKGGNAALARLYWRKASEIYTAIRQDKKAAEVDQLLAALPK